MRDPHIIIGAYIERQRRNNGLVLGIVCHETPVGGWKAGLVTMSLRQPEELNSGHGINLDAALQDLAKAIDSAEHVEIPL